jgi:hypothetical protein
MKQRLLTAALILILVSCITLAAFTGKKSGNKNAAATETTTGYQWTKLTDNALFKKNYNFQLLTHNNMLWAFHPDGNYYSADGRQWTKSSLSNSINNLAFLNYLPFNNSVLGLGHFEGNIEKFKLTTPITQTTDFKTWQTLAAKSNLPERFFYQPVVFKNKIWIFGGTSDGNTNYKDAWSSTNGVSWTKETDNLAFGARSQQQFLVFQNKLFMLDNDVWTSEDGIHWKQLTKKITDVTLFGYTAIVFDEKIWLLGCNRNQQFTSEVLVSSDGITWEKQDAPWSPRGGIAATVLNGKLYMTGGKYGGFKKGTTETEFVYSNDVWALEKIK